MAKGRRVTKAPTRVAGRAGAAPKTMRFYFERSSLMRTIHVDGIFGGVTPHGMIQILPFFEAVRNPKSVVHQLSVDGKLGAELKEQRQVEDAGIVRELEVRLVLDLTTAKSFHNWLGEKIGELEAINSGLRKGAQNPRDLQ